ncbi:MAG: DNA polymerase II [candidate division NC10 bacterium]|nr:DNA polymerase II [candidate division NC10 bacterium]
MSKLPFLKNQVLFGRDPTPRFLAFELEGEDRVRVFWKEDGRVVSALLPFTPFLLLKDDTLLKGFKGDAQIQPLKGSGFYRFLVLFPSWPQVLSARNYLQKVSGKSPSAPDAPYLFLNDAVHQYLLLSGQTSFLELSFPDLIRLQLDIEVYCGEGFEFPKAERERDRIIAIALSDSTGWERVISGKELSEPEMLKALVQVIQKRDPDVIEGHNLFRFDLEYIEARAKRHRVELKLGRDGSLLKSHPSRLQIAERTISYQKYEIFGRHIVDTWLLAQYYDVSARDLEGYGLKDVARHFDLASEDRTYIPPHKISWTFDHDPETLFRYALDDVRETRAISELLSQSYFIQAQIFPYPYQNVILKGNATKIDALLLREYLEERHAVPAPSEGKDVLGGYTDIRHQGVVQNVLHCDVTSLYPSIMLTYGYFSKKDELEVFPSLLKDLKAFRVQAKELMKKTANEEERSYLNALQATFKILINSFYGYLGTGGMHFNDFEEANRVTAKGRELILGIVDRLGQRGCRIIEIDTDGLYFTPPPEVRRSEDEEQLMEEVSRILPEGIRLELDGRFRAMFSYKMKNYALLGDDGKLIIKGSGLKSRGLELFQRVWMEEMMKLLLQGKLQDVKRLTEAYKKRFERHELSVQEFMKTETLQDSLEAYQQKVKAKKRNPAAPYELALKSDRRYQPGDQISYYVTGSGKNVKVHESCKLASEWDPEHPDENVEYYQAKLLDLYEKFKPFIEGEEESNRQENLLPLG